MSARTKLAAAILLALAGAHLGAQGGAELVATIDAGEALAVVAGLV